MSPVLDTTDYYELCIEGLKQTMQQLPYFSDKTFKVSDNPNVVNKGADYWAIFSPASTFSSSKLDPHNRRFVWVVVFDLYVRYKTAEEAPAKFRAVRSAIINWIGVHPTLQGVRGVEDVQLSTRSELLQDTPGDNPNFLIQSLAASIAQRITFKF